jgi:hypothetical protein
MTLQVALAYRQAKGVQDICGRILAIYASV